MHSYIRYKDISIEVDELRMIKSSQMLYIIKTCTIQSQVIEWSLTEGGRAQQVSAVGLEVHVDPADAVVGHPVMLQGGLLTKFLVELSFDPGI